MGHPDWIPDLCRSFLNVPCSGTKLMPMLFCNRGSPTLFISDFGTCKTFLYFTQGSKKTRVDFIKLVWFCKKKSTSNFCFFRAWSLIRNKKTIVLNEKTVMRPRSPGHCMCKEMLVIPVDKKSWKYGGPRRRRGTRSRWPKIFSHIKFYAPTICSKNNKLCRSWHKAPLTFRPSFS
jgi:hypothetical protein